FLATATLLVVTIFGSVFVGRQIWLVPAQPDGNAAVSHGGAAHAGSLPGPGPTGIPEAIWTAHLDGPIGYQPLVEGNQIYVVAGATLSAVDRTSGATDWKFGVNDQFACGAVIAGDLVEIVEG